MLSFRLVWRCCVVVLALLLLAAPGADAAPLSTASSQCQAAVGRAARSLRDAELKAWQRCLDGTLSGRGCDSVARDARIAKARAKSAAYLDARCTADLLFSGEPNGLGFARNCSLKTGSLSPAESACKAIAVSSTASLASCLTCWEEAEVGALLKTLYPCLADQLPDSGVLACGTAPTACPTGPGDVECSRVIGKAGNKLFRTRANATRTCLEAVNRGLRPGPCPDQATSDAINAAASASTTRITRACAQVPAWWDRCPQDSEPCDQTIISVASLTACVNDATEKTGNAEACQHAPGAAADGVQCPVGPPYCGDGVVNTAAEQCDPSGRICSVGQVCQADCTCAASAAPVNSDLAALANGGGCTPTALSLSNPLDMLTLVNPEWAPVVNGTLVSSDPVFVVGTILGGHGDTGGDYPGTHVRSDVNTFVQPDAEYQNLLGTGNDLSGGIPELALEWEAGAYPDWAWGSTGDRIAALGSWIFDCGHPGTVAGHCSVSTSRGCAVDSECVSPACSTCQSQETCVDAHFRYSSEMHPPYATAVMRSGRGAAVPTAASPPVPVTRTDIYVSTDGGAAGDACILQRLSAPIQLLNTECYPLSQPIAAAYLNSRDFSFDVALPPKPAGGVLAWRIAELPAPGGVAPVVDVTPHDDAPAPYLSVSVRLTQATAGGMPTGYAGTLYAGWVNDPTALTHVRVTVSAAVIHNALQPLQPVAPLVCSLSGASCTTSADCLEGQYCTGVGPVKQWRLQVGVNGEWRELSNLDVVNSGDVIPQDITFDQYLPASATLSIRANGASEDCIHALMGRSLVWAKQQIGYMGSIACLLSVPHDPGTVSASYAGPGFGAGAAGTDYETRSSGGDGGNCAANTSQLCLTTSDCPSGDTCTKKGKAYSLRYRIEIIP